MDEFGHEFQRLPSPKRPNGPRVLVAALVVCLAWAVTMTVLFATKHTSDSNQPVPDPAFEQHNAFWAYGQLYKWANTNSTSSMDSLGLHINGSFLLIIDVQNDFAAPGGSMFVSGAPELWDNGSRPIRDLTMSSFGTRSNTQVVYSQDWHPKGHVSFASSHPGAKPYSVIPYTLSQSGKQELWPDHCIQGSWGAELAIERTRPSRSIVKGYTKQVDSYSAYMNNLGVTATPLGYLQRSLAQHRRVYVAGIATNFCVFFSAQDSFAFGALEVAIVVDRVRGVWTGDNSSVVHQKTQFCTAAQDLGIRWLNSSALTSLSGADEVPATQPFDKISCEMMIRQPDLYL